MVQPQHPSIRLPTVSLLMPNRDNAAVLELVLNKLSRHTEYPDVELIVIDDGSTDGSREILRRWRGSQRFSDFRLIEREHGAGGVVDALNSGLAAATGELIVQLDADASIETPGWLSAMVAFFSDPRVGVVTAKIVMDTGEVQACGINVLGAEGYYDRGSEIDEPVGQRTAHNIVRRFGENECPWCNEIAEVDGGMGACMIYRRDAAIEAGGYDVGFAPVWLDDLDLTISMRRLGLKVFCRPQIRVVHHLSRRARPDDRQAAPALPQRAARRARNALGGALPARVRSKIVHALGWDEGPRWYRQRLATHYDYWKKKWGWDLLNPDVNIIRSRWGGTELCWRSDDERRRVGERIVAAVEAQEAWLAGSRHPLSD